VIGDIGVGQVVMQNVPGEGLQWIGGSTYDGPVSHFGTGGTYIMSIDNGGGVQLSVKDGGATANDFGFVITNTSGGDQLSGEVRITE
jgi:hypothetical protein